MDPAGRFAQPLDGAPSAGSEGLPDDPYGDAAPYARYQRVPKLRDDGHILSRFAGKIAHSFKSMRAPRGFGSMAAIGLLVVSAGIGLRLNPDYDRFALANGSVASIFARFVGFNISHVAVEGANRLSKQEVINLSGITTANDLLFLDPLEVQAHLLANPLIAEADVKKLYPNRLLIRVQEREPYALWQKDGVLSLIASDGKVIDRLRDQRFNHLPHVVGEGAEARVEEYVNILSAASDLAEKVRAGSLISQRRWTLTMSNGIDVQLPEEEPEKAFAELAKLDREAQVLDRAIVAVDLRIPGRVVFRLTEEAAQKRNEALDQKIQRKGRA